MNAELKNAIFPGDRLADFDFDAHNAEVRQMSAADAAGRPYRVPIIVGVSLRYFMSEESANPERIDYEEFMEDPDVMFDACLRFQRWRQFNVLQDAELGLPRAWGIYVDYQNFADSAWLGCKVHYMPGEVPDTRPDFADCPERIMEHGIPHPEAGILAKVMRFHERFVERAARETYLGRPIEIGAPWCTVGCDGLLTVCCDVFGPEFVCMAMAAEPERMETLLTFVREALVSKIIHHRKMMGIPIPQPGYLSGDDSIALISNAMYREHVLPHHKLWYDAVATPEWRGIHLCGDSSRHFVTLRDELGICLFDTGFPIDFGRLRAQLGPEVRIQGGPRVEMVRSSTPAAIREEVRRILETGILDGRKFVLREGNNVAPQTPLENTEAMYFAGREFGRYADDAPVMTHSSLGRPG